MNKQEKIVCAAVKVARVKSDYKGVKIVTGVDYQSIYNDGVLSYLANDQDTNIWQNGFITDKNRFVDAKEAMRIAIDAKQMIDINSVISDINLEIEAIEFLVKENNIDEKFSTKKLESLRRKLTRFLKIENRDELKPEDLY